MGRIQVMTPALANQIAAGEVVERPASCVKELVENSIDAGARSILVSIEDGGIASIVVQDDGSGMDEFDLELAFARHATSKIIQARDLFRIATLGFRGEALASIAAVARVSLRSRMHDQERGAEVVVEGSVVQGAAKPTGMPPGTRIEVNDLFFNTPARLKYLRSVPTEQARCVEVVQRAAMSHPEIAFRFVAGGHTVFQTSGQGDVLSVLAAIYGVGEVGQFLHVHMNTPDYRLSGFVGRPTQGKSSRVHGHWFVNYRPIRSLALHQAVVGGYGGRLMVNRHPMYVLYLELDPSLVDVNIHPHKAEVRFSEERDVAQMVQRAVSSSLDEAFLVPGVNLQRDAVSQVRERSGPDVPSVQTGFVLEQQPPSRQTPAVPRGAYARPPGLRQEPQEPFAPGLKGTLRTESSAAMGDLLDVALAPVAMTSGTQDAEQESQTPESVSPPAPVTEPGRETLQRLRPIGQALQMYVLAEDGENLFIIDQHAAHERILYEKFMDQMTQKSVGKVSLLTPVPLRLTPAQHALLKRHLEPLAHMGLEVEEFGGYDVIVRTVPIVWEGLDFAALAEDVIHQLSDSGVPTDVTAFVREQVVSRACKAAVKANRRLADAEMMALCSELANLRDPFHCPHGRPVFIRMSSRELEKEFRRIV